jgi:tetratricopeptide (TPR) repeat protein
MIQKRWRWLIILAVLWSFSSVLAQETNDFFAEIEPYSVPASIAAEEHTPEEAIAILTLAIQWAHPYENLMVTYSDRAMAYTRAGDYEAAIDDWEHSLHFEPDYVRAFVEMGALYIRLEQYDLALENLNHALELDPESAEAYANRGLVHGRLGEYAAAVEDFTAVIDRDNDLDNIFTLLGAAYYASIQDS